MTVNDMNWAEQGGVNTGFGFLFGTMVGGVKYCWTLAPGLHAESKPTGSQI